MRPFTYEVATDMVDAARLGRLTEDGPVDAPTQFMAGGTTLLDLMKLDVMRPTSVVDISALRGRYGRIEHVANGVRLGALVRMSAAAADVQLLADYPAIAQSLQLAASAQIRNMATLGGNVLQRTRCNYFRDPSWVACNKRSPGSGCSAMGGLNRNHAVLGTDDSCIAQYPGDFGVALVAFDAQVELDGGARGPRRFAFAELHRPAQGKPHQETTLAPGEIITSFLIPRGAWSRRSLYLKVRDRSSYEFALASAAIGLDMGGDVVRGARIGLGGLAYRPWRSIAAEGSLIGKPLTERNAEAAAAIALHGSVTHGHNGFKPELGRRTLVRALLEARSLTIPKAERSRT